MKKTLITLFVAIAAGVLAFYLMRSLRMAAQDEVLLDSMPELAWMKTDLKANDEQLAKVTELHLAYRPTCVELCRRIRAAHAKVDSLAGSKREITPELEAAILEHAKTHAECKKAMLEHLYRTAALFSPEQAKHYIETVLPIALESTRSSHSRHE